MTKEASYTEQLDETIQHFSAQFEAILATIVREAVARVVTNVAITQRWPKGAAAAPALAPVRRGRPKGSKNKPKVPVVPHCSTSGCVKAVTAKGLCSAHYRKAWRDAKRAGTANGITAAVAS